jgi:hypothetical protein
MYTLTHFDTDFMPVSKCVSFSSLIRFKNLITEGLKHTWAFLTKHINLRKNILNKILRDSLYECVKSYGYINSYKTN